MTIKRIKMINTGFGLHLEVDNKTAGNLKKM